MLIPQGAFVTESVAPLLQVKHLTKRYGRVTALSEVSFSIRPGEILGLIGPNGSGKTTLFECLAGVLPADGGSIIQNSRPLGPRERSAAVFYLPDAIAPWPDQRVRWALDFALGFFGGPAQESAEVVRRFDLEPILDRAIGSLSKGQRKRALLAMSCLTPQPLLLCDEPFEGLDLRQTREVAAALRICAERGRTLLLSFHQMADAARICDRFLLLSAGHVRGEGTLEELSATAAMRGVPVSAERGLEEIFLALT